MQRLMRLTALLGLALTLGLVWQHRTEALQAVSTIGFGLLPVVLIHLAQLWWTGLGWHAVADTAEPIPAWTYVWTRWIRESISGLLPVAQLGGEVIGGRLLVLCGARKSEAAASITVDLTLEALTLVVFILVGLGYAAQTGNGRGLIGYTLIGLAAFVPAVLMLLFLQRQGVMRLLDRLALWLNRHWPKLRTEGLRSVHEAIEACYRRPGGLARGFFWHLCAWLAGVLEIYAMALAIDMPVTLGQALIIESLGQAIRSAAFFVPAGLGVQEGSLLLLAAELGLAPGTGLALALVKRLRELVLGLPGLYAWHVIERGRWARFIAPASRHGSQAP